MQVCGKGIVLTRAYLEDGLCMVYRTYKSLIAELTSSAT